MCTPFQNKLIYCHKIIFAHTPQPKVRTLQPKIQWQQIFLLHSRTILAYNILPKLLTIPDNLTKILLLDYLLLNLVQDHQGILIRHYHSHSVKFIIICWVSIRQYPSHYTPSSRYIPGGMIPVPDVNIMAGLQNIQRITVEPFEKGYNP